MALRICAVSTSHAYGAAWDKTPHGYTRTWGEISSPPKAVAKFLLTSMELGFLPSSMFSITLVLRQTQGTKLDTDTVSSTPLKSMEARQMVNLCPGHHFCNVDPWATFPIPTPYQCGYGLA